MVKIINPIQINDWSIRTLLCVTFAFQISLVGFIALDMIGIQILVIRQIVSHISLTFIPGILILRILKLHKLGTAKTLLYATGLSIFTLMFTGFIINLVYPYFGILEPISLVPLILTLSAVISILSFLAYIRDKDFSNPDFFDLNEIFSPCLLILFLIPFLSVFGTYLVNYSSNNILLMSMIIVISFLILLNNYIPSKFYPLAIWVIAISLIYHITLISEYININDVLREYKVVDSVIEYSYWNWTTIGNSNSVLSISILAPIFFHIYDFSLTYVFKIIYPLLFSITSIGVYLLSNNVVNNRKISFMSSILFVIAYPFFYQVPLICKQSIAEVFFVLLLLSIFDDNLKSITKSLLAVIFSISLIVSHYGISYLMLLSLIFILLCTMLIRNEKVNIILSNVYIKVKNEKLMLNLKEKNNISLNFIILFLTLTIGWYIYISGSSSFSSLLYIGHDVFHRFIEDFANLENFMNPEHSRGLYTIAKSEVSHTHYITKIFYFTTQFFIIIGFLNSLWNYNKYKLDITYIFISLYFLLILFAAIVLAGFAVMDPQRLYHLSLFVLSPFCIIGGFTICELVCTFWNKCYQDNFFKYSYRFFAVFLSIFLLFSTGFMYEVTNDYPSSISLSQRSIISFNDKDRIANFYSAYIVVQNVFSGKWLDQNMIDNEKVYRGDDIDSYPCLCVYNNIDPSCVIGFDNTTKNIGSGYIHISYLNNLGIGSTWSNYLKIRTTYNFSDVHFLEQTDRIYDNGGSNILWKSSA